MRSPRMVIVAACFAASTALSLQVTAAVFGLSPMRIELAASSPTAVMNVSNPGEHPITIQVRSYTWSQPNGVDLHEETRGFIISPSIFTIPAGETQLVRVALRTPPVANVEKAYRLVIAEIPQAEEIVTGQAVFRIAINMNIPMYVAPISGIAGPSALFAVEHRAEGARLRIDNHGSGNLRLADFTVAQEEARLADVEVLVVLPGATRFIDVPGDKLRPGKPLRVRAQSNGGPIDVSVPAATL